MFSLTYEIFYIRYAEHFNKIFPTGEIKNEKHCVCMRTIYLRVTQNTEVTDTNHLFSFSDPPIHPSAHSNHTATLT